MFENPELFKKFGKVFEPGKVVFCEYEKGDELYFVISGKVKISKITKEKEKVVAYLGPGEFLGEMAIFEKKPRTATVITEEETKMLVLKKDDFFNLMQVAPNLVVELIKTLSIRYINTLKQLNSLMVEDVEKRVINYFYEKCLSINNEKIRKLEININEISSILNISKDVLVEKMMPYQKRGYIRINAEQIILNDIGWWTSIRSKN